MAADFDRDDVRHIASRSFWLIPSEKFTGKSSLLEAYKHEVELLSWIVESMVRSQSATEGTGTKFSFDLNELAPLNEASGVTPDQFVDFPLEMTFTENDASWSCRFPMNESGDFCLIRGLGKTFVKYSTIGGEILEEQLEQADRDSLFANLFQLNKALDAYCRLNGIQPIIRDTRNQTDALDLSKAVFVTPRQFHIHARSLNEWINEDQPTLGEV